MLNLTINMMKDMTKAWVAVTIWAITAALMALTIEGSEVAGYLLLALGIPLTVGFTEVLKTFKS